MRLDRTSRDPSRNRGFTLLELLIVIAIIAALATILLTTMGSAKRRTQIAVARSQISALKAALANYKSDMGRYPRLTARPTVVGANGNSPAYEDDCVALYAGLRNKPTVEVGGGQNSPYVDGWKAEYVGYLNGPTDVRTINGMMSVLASEHIAAIDPDDHDKMLTLQFQQTHLPSAGPGANGPLVFLDPWGNPYHYREWLSVRSNVKDSMVTTATNRSPIFDPGDVGPVMTDADDRPHSTESYDIWSSGPNGVNEFGSPESDDVCSWRD